MKGHREPRKGNEAPRRSKASTGNGRLLQGNCQAWQPGRRFQATDQESWCGQAVTNRQPPIRKRLVDVRPDPNLPDGRPLITCRLCRGVSRRGGKCCLRLRARAAKHACRVSLQASIRVRSAREVPGYLVGGVPA